MNASMSDLKKKINLQIDEYYENFCDVLHDNIIGENHLLISPGEKKKMILVFIVGFRCLKSYRLML
jgi:hypothetical protein